MLSRYFWLYFHPKSSGESMAPNPSVETTCKEAASAVLDPQYAELAELAGGFIHEIKNHLSTLGLNLQLLSEDFEDPQSQRERLRAGAR